MPQATHESTAFNSRNREVAIHCVFSVKDNTHSILSFYFCFEKLFNGYLRYTEVTLTESLHNSDEGVALGFGHIDKVECDTALG